MTFNRTILELKFRERKRAFDPNDAFNRTILELKWLSESVIEMAQRHF